MAQVGATKKYWFVTSYEMGADLPGKLLQQPPLTSTVSIKVGSRVETLISTGACCCNLSTQPASTHYLKARHQLLAPFWVHRSSETMANNYKSCHLPTMAQLLLLLLILLVFVSGILARKTGQDCRKHPDSQQYCPPIHG
ncbi:hypothetical protein ABZP36_019701 [Zizania latifolia]